MKKRKKKALKIIAIGGLITPFIIISSCSSPSSTGVSRSPKPTDVPGTSKPIVVPGLPKPTGVTVSPKPTSVPGLPKVPGTIKPTGVTVSPKVPGTIKPTGVTVSPKVPGTIKPTGVTVSPKPTSVPGTIKPTIVPELPKPTGVPGLPGLSSSITNIVIIRKENPIVSGIDIADEKYKELLTLQKIFWGLNSKNVEFFIVSINPKISDEQSKYVITLTAKAGYKINQGEEFLSKEFVIKKQETVLKVLEINGEKDKKLTNAEFIWLEDDINPSDDLVILQKLFEGLNKDNIINVKLAYYKDSKTITLTANEGFIFANNETSIFAAFKVDLKVKVGTISESMRILSWKDLSNLTKWESVEFDDLKKTLNKLFAGFEQMNDSDFKSIIESVSLDWIQSDITLTTKEGYIFNENGTNKLSSGEFKLAKLPLKNIIVKSSVELSLEDINNLTSWESTEFVDLKTTINKLFTGFEAMEDSNFKSIISKITIDMNSKIITLTAIEGLTFSEGKTNKISSSSFKLAKIPLNITPKSSVELSLEDINNLTSWESTEFVGLKTTINKLFTGFEAMEDSNFKSIISKLAIDMNSKIITLTAKDEFTFSESGTNELFSSKFELAKLPLDIAPKSSTELSPEDTNNLEIWNMTEFDDLKKTLNKLFTGFETMGDFGFKSVISKITIDKNSKIITLTAIKGFTFSESGTKKLSSSKFELTKLPLNISPKNLIELSSKDLRNLTKWNSVKFPKLKNALNKIFTGFEKMKNSDFKSVISKITIDKNSKIITLTAVEGITFVESGINELSSNKLELSKFPLTIITKSSVELSLEDINNLTTWESVKFTDLKKTLNKLFTGFEKNGDFDFKFIISNIIINSGWKNITLTAGEGFTFSETGKNELSSSSFKIAKIPLNITPKSSTELSLEDLSNLITWDSIKFVDLKKILDKLFTNFETMEDFGFKSFISKIAIDPDSKIITLTAAKGLTFSKSGTSELSSSPFELAKLPLDIAPKNLIELSSKDLKKLANWNNVKFPKLKNTLNKMFTGFEKMGEVRFKAIISNIEIDLRSIVITLTAGEEFIFSESNSNKLTLNKFITI